MPPTTPGTSNSSPTPARAYAADVAVRAFAADHQPDRCRETLDQEYAALQAFRSDEPPSSWWYFYDESFYWRAGLPVLTVNADRYAGAGVDVLTL